MVAAVIWASSGIGSIYIITRPDPPQSSMTSEEAYSFGQSDYFRTVFGNVGYTFAGGPQTSLDSWELQYLPAIADGRPKLCVVVTKYRLPDGSTVIQQSGNIHQC